LECRIVNNLIAIIGDIDGLFTTSISVQAPLPIARERVEGTDFSRLQSGCVIHEELSAGGDYQASIAL
jgi:hypothetical protein